MAKPGCAGDNCTLQACKANYFTARAQAFARSGEMCQFCGSEPAVDAHHWELTYTPNCEVTSSHLIGLCKTCHFTASCFRRLCKEFKDSQKELGDMLKKAGADKGHQDVSSKELQDQRQIILTWVTVGEATIARQEAITQIAQTQEGVSKDLRALRTDMNALIAQRGKRKPAFATIAAIAAITILALYLSFVNDIPAFLFRLFQMYAPWTGGPN